MARRTWRIAPGTALGKWAVALIVAMPILFATGTSFGSTIYQTIPAGRTILADVGARPALALTMLAGMVAGISGFITGLLAIVNQKEEGVLVYAATAIGALLVGFLAGEVLSPH